MRKSQKGYLEKITDKIPSQVAPPIPLLPKKRRTQRETLHKEETEQS